VIRPLTLLVALVLLLAAPITASAQVQPPHPSGGGGNLVQAPNFVEVVVPCAANAHYVQTHRNNQGHWVKGRCVPNGGAAVPAH
jgi:hypothetical protein